MAMLPEGWSQHLDAGTGNVFYHCAATNETSWTPPAIAAPVAPAEDSELEDSGEELDDIPDHLRMANPARARTSVSAEAYGQWNQKLAFEAPRHEKTHEQMDRLRATLYKSFLFQGLETWDVDTLLLAMREEVFEAGHWVFSEGEDGDFLFVTEYGTLDCIKNLGGQATIVKQCSSGDVFGELALLYNCPRAAGVQARTVCVCWKLDRETFNHVVRDAAVKRRDMHDGFLKGVPLLTSLGSYERSQIADALQPERYQYGETLISQGDSGERFYIVEQGQLQAFKDDTPVMIYNPGDFFGELALLTDQPRAASVRVASESCKVLTMSRSCFTQMLGPLASLLEKSYV